MRHGKKLNSLSRKAAHRKAMLANMACSLIQHKRIETTVAKAKALRVYIEPLLTKAKTDSTHSRRTVFSYLQSKDAVTELFREISPKIADRPGGYTRIIRLGNRLGDNAEMCMIELVDYNELMTKEPKEKKTRRSRRGGGAKAKTQDTSAKTEETKEEAPKAEKKSEAKAEKKEAAPKAEKKEAPKAEKKETAKKAEARKDEPKAEKKEAKKSDDKKDDAPKAKKAAPKKEEKKEDKKDDKEEK